MHTSDQCHVVRCLVSQTSGKSQKGFDRNKCVRRGPTLSGVGGLSKTPVISSTIFFPKFLTDKILLALKFD